MSEMNIPVTAQTDCTSDDRQIEMRKPSIETVHMISDLYNEPDWMRQSRLDAWQHYEALPLPNPKAEAWRRTSLKQYPLDTMRLTFSERELDGIADLPPCWNYTLAPVDQVSGMLVHCNGAQSYATLRRSDARKGVIFGGLHDALQTHSDVIQRYWLQSQSVRPEESKFNAFNAALWHGGTFVYVPEGVRVDRPLQSLVTYNGDGGTAVHHTLVIAERGSHITLIQDRVSQERDAEMNVEVVEVYAEPGAWVRYISLQHWGDQRYSVSTQNVHARESANVMWVTGSLGGKMTKDFLRSDLVEPQARSNMYGFSFVRGQQHLDQSTYQHHRAPDTHSDLLFRNILQDKARSVFYGMIRVEPEAQHTQAYQANNNLMLGDARANSIPGLEIIANDVKCSHGATVSRIDQEQAFYLQARGLPRAEAERLIVQGFVRPIVERVPLAYQRDRLDEEFLELFLA